MPFSPLSDGVSSSFLQLPGGGGVAVVAGDSMAV